MVPVKQALADAHLKPGEMDEVVLVGGTHTNAADTRTVQEFFDRKPHTELNPDEVVALGAAVQANISRPWRAEHAAARRDAALLGHRDLRRRGCQDPFLAIRPFPPAREELYTTGVDNQTGSIFTSCKANANSQKIAARSPASTPEGSPAPAGLPRIEVKFLIDANGILQVGAKDVRTGVQHLIEVQPSYGLNDNDIERMLEESIEYAEQDFAERQTIEAAHGAKSIDRHGQSPGGSECRGDEPIRTRPH